MLRSDAARLLLLLAALVPIASSIKCYICNTNDDIECEREPQKLRLIECDTVVEKPHYVRYNPLLGRASGCMKRIAAYDNATLSVVRECYFGSLTDTVDGCLELHTNWTPMTRIQSCNICNESACNGVDHMQLSYTFAIEILVVITDFLIRWL